MPETEVDARAALQALFAASRPRTPQGSDILGQSTSADGESACQKAGVALRQLFKGDMQKALYPPKAAGRLKEIESHVGKLLDQVSPAAKFKPPPRARAPLKPKNGVDMEVQTVAMMAMPTASIPEPVQPEVIPDPDEGKPRHRCCILQDSSENGDAMRRKTSEARKKLFEQDREVTTLTRELKLLRKSHWELQQNRCAKEQEIENAIKAHAEKQPSNGETSQEDLSKKQEELCIAKQQAKQWSKQARRMDAELQQQFRGGGDVQRILLRHPAGEVFLPPMGAGGDSEDGSDDDYYREAPRRESVELASSDEESEEFRGGRPLGGAGETKASPPAPSQQWRGLAADDDDEASDATSMTSPSGESGGGLTPNGDAAPRNRLAAGPSVTSVTKVSSDTESSHSSDDEKASPKPKAAAQSKTVPPLPDLSGLGSSSPPAAKAASKTQADIDLAEEVSSEDIWSQEEADETSRSV